ncbi:flippase [Natronosalvus vescus]|uniref:flippase n=1 Tax=Natronosalvus vescus TaxID=2953881 RepID=UPI002090C139|nr:flippase [Natronosalvus vescus]
MTTLEEIVSRFKIEFVAQFVAVGAGGLLLVLLARLLEPAEYGLLFLAIAVFGVLGVVSKLGIAKSGARYVAEYKERDPSQLPHILRTCLLYNLATIGIVVVALAVGHQLIADALGEPALAPLLVLGIGYVVVESLKVYVRLVLQGFESIQFAGTIYALDQASRLVFAVTFVLLGFGALGALAGYILSFTLAAGIGLIVIYVHHYRPHRGEGAVEPGLRRRIAEYTAPLTATSTANVLDKQIDTVLVGFFLTPVAVSYYVLSKQIVHFVETPVKALGFTISPTFGAEKASGNSAHAARIYEQALIHTLLLYIPIAVGLVLVARPTIALIFGSEYLEAVVVLQVLSAYIVLQSITTLTSNSLDYLGRAKSRAIVKGVTAVMNVVLNVILIPRLGVVGAAVATVITYSLYTVANVVIIHQEFPLQLGRVARSIGQIVTITGVMAAVVYIVRDAVHGFVSLFSVVALGVVVWAVLAIATGLLSRQKLTSIA